MNEVNINEEVKIYTHTPLGQRTVSDDRNYSYQFEYNGFIITVKAKVTMKRKKQ